MNEVIGFLKVKEFPKPLPMKGDSFILFITTSHSANLDKAEMSVVPFEVDSNRDSNANITNSNIFPKNKEAIKYETVKETKK